MVLAAEHPRAGHQHRQAGRGAQEYAAHLVDQVVSRWSISERSPRPSPRSARRSGAASCWRWRTQSRRPRATRPRPQVSSGLSFAEFPWRPSRNGSAAGIRHRPINDVANVGRQVPASRRTGGGTGSGHDGRGGGGSGTASAWNTAASGARLGSGAADGGRSSSAGTSGMPLPNCRTRSCIWFTVYLWTQMARQVIVISLLPAHRA